MDRQEKVHAERMEPLGSLLLIRKRKDADIVKIIDPKKKVQVALMCSSVSVFAIGIIGLCRTFMAYGRIDVLAFAAYALLSVILMALTIWLVAKTLSLNDFVMLKKPPVKKNEEEHQSNPTKSEE